MRNFTVVRSQISTKRCICREEAEGTAISISSIRIGGHQLRKLVHGSEDGDAFDFQA